MMCKERKIQKEKFDQDNAEQMTDDEYRRFYGRGREKAKEDKARAYGILFVLYLCL